MKPHKRRSQEQWQLLIKEQQSSRLNAAEFCRQKGLNDKYFSKCQHQLSTQNGKVEQKPFIRLGQSEKPERVQTLSCNAA